MSHKHFCLQLNSFFCETGTCPGGSSGLRFFTVSGPAGRPDMAYFGFTNKLLKGETIQIFNYGNCRRDFTYVDDIVEGVYRVMQGDVPVTYADATALERDSGFTPKITLREGLRKFAQWYKEYYYA